MNSDLKNHITETLNKGLRFDGRKTNEYRKITVEYGITKSAEGSARVKIGDTEVIGGVKLEVGTPYPDTPDEGTIIVGAELIPLSSPEFESGPPGIQAIELARVVDRGIRESKALDFKKLCIESGEKVWLVLIDVIPLNDDGNLFDAASLAALAALKDARFPAFDGKKVDYKKKTKEKLPLSKEPISITVLKIGKNYLVDPSPEEEEVLDSRLTVATMADGALCALQKGGDMPINTEDIDKMIDIALEKSKELRKHL